jgi:group I intron endonuclease
MNTKELINISNGTIEGSGVYIIFCTTSYKALIGSSKLIRRRFNEHSSKLKNNKHINQHLQNIYNKYGKDSLKYLIIENCSEDIQYEREAHFINLLDEDLRLNKAAVTKAVKTSLETRLKMSQKAKGRIPWNKGKTNVYSKETLNKMSLAKKDFVPWTKGKPMSKEQKEKLSLILRTKYKLARLNKGLV